jgi:hypothetical protein
LGWHWYIFKKVAVKWMLNTKNKAFLIDLCELT